MRGRPGHVGASVAATHAHASAQAQFKQTKGARERGQDRRVDQALQHAHAKTHTKRGAFMQVPGQASVRASLRV